MTVCATQAQTANDSVRIKLQTTAGADIAIDGDWSSTNIMYTKVATGQHNVTVRYGSLFEKTTLSKSALPATPNSLSLSKVKPISAVCHKPQSS